MAGKREREKESISREWRALFWRSWLPIVMAVSTAFGRCAAVLPIVRLF
jgi:hypothetical protein